MNTEDNSVYCDRCNEVAFVTAIDISGHFICDSCITQIKEAEKVHNTLCSCCDNAEQRDTFNNLLGDIEIDL